MFLCVSCTVLKLYKTHSILSSKPSGWYFQSGTKQCSLLSRIQFCFTKKENNIYNIVTVSCDLAASPTHEEYDNEGLPE